MTARRKEAQGDARNLGRWTIVLLSIGGFAAAWYLVEMHVQALLGQEIGGALCRAHSLLDCQAVAHSSFSTLGGAPIALLGLCFYAAMGLLALFDRESQRSSERAFRPAAMGVTLYGGALLYSLFLAGVSIFSIKKACLFCVMLYLVNGLGFLATLAWAGRGPGQVIRAQIKDLGGIFNGGSALFLLTFGFVFLVATQIVDTSIWEGEIKERQRSEAKRAQIYDEADYRVSDAPSRGPEDGPVHITLFSTFPCPYCGTFSLVLEVLSKEFEEELRVEYRHFPVPGQEYGLETAYAAHCAGEQGAFWPMQDLLFDRAPAHEPEQILEYARALELDEALFQRCLASPQTAARIEVDRQAGAKLGVDGTPTFFINGKKIEGALQLDMLRRLVQEELKGQESEFPRED